MAGVAMGGPWEAVLLMARAGPVDLVDVQVFAAAGIRDIKHFFIECSVYLCINIFRGVRARMRGRGRRGRRATRMRHSYCLYIIMLKYT